MEVGGPQGLGLDLARASFLWVLTPGPWGAAFWPLIQSGNPRSPRGRVCLVADLGTAGVPRARLSWTRGSSVTITHVQTQDAPGCGSPRLLPPSPVPTPGVIHAALLCGLEGQYLPLWVGETSPSKVMGKNPDREGRTQPRPGPGRLSTAGFKWPPPEGPLWSTRPAAFQSPQDAVDSMALALAQTWAAT